ncbi:uncharacterized protein LOC129228455 [Uloborus diversus]|uniref:uncharacterized protein LOC129228455 n=1 Tax=Uloborus diversus TaxID=327109 RepID=UPI0024096CCA|nr:uncharacterized protein LOC129228455 [Uloborus diversus]
MIKITNFNDADTVNVSLPQIHGEIIVSGDSEISVCNENLSIGSVTWPVINGKFKAFVQLSEGENSIRLEHKSSFIILNLIYVPLNFRRFIRLVYIKCKDDDGSFQVPEAENSSLSSACKRITLGAQMLQTFTWDKIKEHCSNGRTFCLEETDGKVICHVFSSKLTVEEAHKLSEQELWSHFAVELMNSNLRLGNRCKFLAFLSFTRYCNYSNLSPKNHKEVLRLTKGQVALGGGGLALFGSGCLHTWAEDVSQIPWRFGDKRKIDRKKLMDDSANRGWHWACYSTGLGATLHELGHTFDLGHTKGGIMGRGFDDIYKYFIVDLFYYDHAYQQKYNPYYQKSSIHNQTVPFTLSPLASWKSSAETSLQYLQSQTTTNEQVPREVFDASLNEKPWSLPTLPEVWFTDATYAVNVGQAYWERSSALILYYHKWFNDHEDESTPSLTRYYT